MRAWGMATAIIITGALGAGCAPATATCTPACSSSTTCCETGCMNTLVDSNNCGGCGVACGAGQMCSIGHCVAAGDSGVHPDGGRDAAVTGNCHPSCASGMMCCGTTCVSAVGIATGDARTDPSFMNCRVCGVACDATNASRCGLPHGTSTGPPQCLCGDLPTCLTGEVCELSGGSFSCINHMTDPRHCGTPGVACMAGEACVTGVCTCNGADGGVGGECPAGLSCTASGCIDVMTDPSNCGTLGTVCRAGETCTAGMCGCGTSGTRCTMGGIGMCGQTCCGNQCVYVDDYNCGGCGVACTGTDVCVHGAFGGMTHCGAEGAFVIACDAPVDAAPFDGGDAIDAGTDDAATDDANTNDAATDDANTNDAGCSGVLLTVHNYLAWCSVSVDGGAATTAATQTVCVPADTDINLVATAASSSFILGDWHHTDGDTAGTGDPGTVSGAMSTATFMTSASGAACVWICCPFTSGSGCPVTDQCP